MKLFLCHVTTTLEGGFEAGCHILVEAKNGLAASDKAYDIESDAVGSGDDELRQTSVGGVAEVPPEAEAFLRKVMGVNQ